MKADKTVWEEQGLMSSVTRIPEWQALREHAETLGQRHLRELFAEDAARADRLSAEAAGLYFDYSKQRVNEKTVRLLMALARARGLPEHRDALFAGERVNVTEHRPALHVALRAPKEECIRVDGHNVVPDVHAMLERMSAFSRRIRSGEWTGYTGRPIRNVVNIGIGGSGVGPMTTYEALRDYAQSDLTLRFVSNADGTDFSDSTRDLELEETLFIVCSNSFATQETLTNAHAARRWCLDVFGDEEAVSHHFVAVSSHAQRVRDFGIDPDNSFGIWEWVGGRYSIGSAVGLSTMVAIGPENFRAMLDGFRAMDEHFRSAPLENNLPALLGMLGIWNNNFLGTEGVAVLPYADRLSRFPAYIQQLSMESNGKRVTQEGEPVDVSTSAVHWGMVGTDAQHSFMQMVHQGTRTISCDFIGFCEPLSPLHDQHDLLMANLFAQSETLAFGKTAWELRAAGEKEELIPAKTLPGNRPNTTILADRLEPRSLGALIALYEHSVFVRGTVWNINPFDQWGVETGKKLANQFVDAFGRGEAPESGHDGSTLNLIQRYQRIRGEAV